MTDSNPITPEKKKLSISQILFRSRATQSTSEKSPSPTKLPEEERIAKIWRKKGFKIGDDSISPKKPRSFGGKDNDIVRLYFFSGTFLKTN